MRHMCLYLLPADPDHGQAQWCVWGRGTTGHGMMSTDFVFSGAYY